ncbi:MAG: SDR family NAD(P)-dependent oxidoreductase [Vicinamibacteria bacterium]
MNLRLDGKGAVVTGGGRGIGRAISILLARLGARVCVNYVGDAGAAAETVAKAQAAGGEAFAIQADVSKPEEAGRLVAEAVARFGDLDILVVNHGIWKRASIQEMTPAEWDETIRVNLGGAYAVCHHAARVMIPRKSGAIVTIASTSGQRGEAHYSHYSASKGAMIALTKSLARELAPHGIRVNGVAPGWVMTDMTRKTLEGQSASQALSPIPVGRAGTAEEIAGPVAFLASGLSSYLCGEILCVNGGAVMAD